MSVAYLVGSNEAGLLSMATLSASSPVFGLHTVPH